MAMIRINQKCQRNSYLFFHVALCLCVSVAKVLISQTWTIEITE